jgi:hypothetical protein
MSTQKPTIHPDWTKAERVSRHEKPSRRPSIDYFESKGDGGAAASTVAARSEFLDLVAEESPDLLIDLADDPYQRWLIMAERTICSGYLLTWREIEARCAWDDQAVMLRDAIIRWAHSYHLNWPWVYERAARTLSAWSLTSSNGNRTWFHPIQSERCLFSDSRRGDKNGEERLSSSKARFEAERRGGQRMPEIRASTGARPAGDHLRWLVLRVVKRHSKRKLAQDFGRNSKSITEGLQRAAALVKIGLPPVTTGRPKES